MVHSGESREFEFAIPAGSSFSLADLDTDELVAPGAALAGSLPSPWILRDGELSYLPIGSSVMHLKGPLVHEITSLASDSRTGPQEF